jgi:PUA domain protein
MSSIRRRYIREKEARKLLAEILERVKLDSMVLPRSKLKIELAHINEEEIFLIDKKPIFARSNGNLFPTLVSSEILSSLPKVTVNMGALPYICNGADIMAPGIVNYEGTFKKEDIVVVIDETHKKPIAITIAFHAIEKAKQLEHGKILNNIHHIGDELWNAIKQMNTE